jgi:hypothetical protein
MNELRFRNRFWRKKFRTFDAHESALQALLTCLTSMDSVVHAIVHKAGGKDVR